MTTFWHKRTETAILALRYCFLFIGLLPLIKTSAQETVRDEISAYVGFPIKDTYLSSMQKDFVRDVYGSSLGGTRIETEFAISLGVQYLRGVTEKISVGGMLGMAQARNSIKKPTEYRSHELAKSYDCSFAVMGVAKYLWFTRNTFQVYSKADVGVQYSILTHRSYIPERKERKVRLAYQMSAVGMSFQGGFLEIGYGHQGFLSAGVSLGLPYKRKRWRN